MAVHLDSRGRSAAGFSVRDELGLIPWWAWVLAAAVFTGVQLLFHWAAWPWEANPPALLFRLLFPVFLGVMPAFWMLLVGYVNGDAARRGMGRLLWTLVVIVIPSGIGFILYFVLRQPVQGGCPGCGGAVDARANYCPQCRHTFHQTCRVCRGTVGPADRYCATCGADLAEAA
jgi:hypothetical protein